MTSLCADVHQQGLNRVEDGGPGFHAWLQAHEGPAVTACLSVESPPPVAADNTVPLADHGHMSMPATQWPEAEQRIAEVARTRRGRHRDNTLASYRRTRALELRAQGKGYAEIAAAVDYANKGTAHKVISQALEAREAQDVDFLRQTETARLDAMQVALWPEAMEGNVRAAMAVLQIIEARCRMWGLLEKPPARAVKDPKGDWDNCQGPPTVIIRQDDCRHQGCDKHGRF
jgi:hypothetical protein